MNSKVWEDIVFLGKICAIKSYKKNSQLTISDIYHLEIKEFESFWN